MAKYIDVEALGIGIARAEIFANPEFARGWNNAIKIINNAPAADVVEVVRCENCIRRGTEDCAMYYGCECGEQGSWETDNDFCSWGERRNNE